MASSRKPRPPSDAAGALLEALGNPTAAGVAVALSGGIDSVCLLHALAARGFKLHALHVHHGLNTRADDWQSFCEALCARLRVPLQVCRVDVEAAGRGIEEAARTARYAALTGACIDLMVPTIALAHHLDDQAETVLLQLLRGAGPAGVAGMSPRSARAGVAIWRPWLEFPRSAIEAYAAEHGLEHVDDDSNRNARFVRNALRLQVMPAIARHFPAYRQTLTRFARHAAQADRLLDEVAAEDLASVRDRHPVFGDALRLTRLSELRPARRMLVLRAWLAAHDLRAPSEARLVEMARQLERSARDAQPMLQHQHAVVRRYRDWVVIDRTVAAQVAPEDGEDQVTVVWNGEARIDLPQWGGAIAFEPAGRGGVARERLLGKTLRIGPRRGRERLRLVAGRPSRTLKNLYQEAGVPSWERDRLPLVWVDGSLAFAAGLGLDARWADAADGQGIALRWESAPSGLALGEP